MLAASDQSVARHSLHLRFALGQLYINVFGTFLASLAVTASPVYHRIAMELRARAVFTSLQRRLLFARGVLQSIRSACSQPPRCRRGATFCGVRCSFRDFRRSVAAALVSRSRFAVGPCPGCAVFPYPPRVRLRLGKGPQPLVEFHAPLKSCPDRPSQTAAAIRRLSWTSVPFGTCRIRRSTLMRAVPARAFRPQGLATLATACSRRIRAGFVSRRQHPWVSPFGAFSSQRVATAFPPCAEPTCRSIPRFTPPPKRQRRLARPRLLGPFPLRIPCPMRRVERFAEPVAPLGILPFQGSPALIPSAGISRAALSHAYRSRKRPPDASQSISTSARPRP
jgi:hypothetical protein